MLVGMWVRRTADFGLVDVLAAGAARSHDVGTYIVLIDVDLDAVVDHRKDHDAGERRMPARIGIEWRDAHQPMYAVFAFEPAIGVVALDLHGRRLDAGALAFALLEPVDLVAVRLGPAHIHAHQHAGPILALGAAGAGVHFEIAVVGVGLAGEQRFQLTSRHFRPQALERGFCFKNGLVVFFGFAQFDHGELVGELLLDAADGVEPVLQSVAFAHHALAARLVAPERGILGLFVQLGEAALRGLDVKDASSAAAPTA